MIMCATKTPQVTTKLRLWKVHQTTWCRLNWIRSQPYFLRSNSSKARYNSVNIQMLSESLHQQIFKNAPAIKLCDKSLKTIETHLKKHELAGKPTTTLPDVDLKLPPLYGVNIDDHFIHIANQQIAEYKILINEIVSNSLPKMPDKWQKMSGWTKYLEDGTYESVPYPDDRGLIFDIECLMAEGNFPTMATAVSSRHWYSWVSDYVLEDKFRLSKTPSLKDLIPLETKLESTAPPDGKWQPRLIIGHNVGFDRSFIKEQYFIQGTQMRFLDTMSMHIAVCGLTGFQRLLHNASKKESHRKEIVEHANRQKLFSRASSDEWKTISSLNNLRDVHQLHCGGEALEKSKKSVFVEGNMTDVRDQFQDLMIYCANDVQATREVFLKLWPDFKERFPHPVTLAGMLEMGTAYLPINDAWPRYINNSDSTFEESQRELKKLLMALANDACRFLENEEYKNDPWLWDLEWKLSAFRLNKTSKNIEKIVDPFHKEDAETNLHMKLLAEEEGEKSVEKYKKLIRKVWATGARVPKNSNFTAGFPLWYKQLCPRPTDEEFAPGPSLISTQCRVTPKLMRMMWNGFPIHYDDKHGWGYLIPHHEELTPLEMELRKQDADFQEQHGFPLQSFLSYVNGNKKSLNNGSLPGDNGVEGSNDAMEVLGRDFEEHAMELEEKLSLWEVAKDKKLKIVPKHVGTGPFDIDIPGVRFYKIPHKDGDLKRVGNPLARDYLQRIEDGTLTASTDAHADRVLFLGKMCSYWKNNQKRITGQMEVWLKKSELDKSITGHPDYENEGLYGAIVPRIVTAGTVTRRAVEPTWLTASNAYKDRIGSELKAMIQSPPDYKFVGADVDSQELWIAAVLGDAYFMKEHGCTALGWMTLQGNKTDKTDLHSKTAQIINISRDHAKVMNYGRIYGAGVTFAEKQLRNFNPQLSVQEAKKKATTMYKQTKGQRNAQRQWIGGTESYMFNALESIACSEKPVTPVLGCNISRALEPNFVLDDFITSRINWVVQSSAVDYLHLMLVCMRWLLTSYKIEGRFCISIHDEVRYLVKNPDCHRAALALQITNLLTRAMFSYKLGMNDLPQSVAFFSAVDVDACLRKEVEMDCVTPSNPHGLKQSYSVPPGESLDIFEIMKKTGGNL